MGYFDNFGVVDECQYRGDILITGVAVECQYRGDIFITVVLHISANIEGIYFHNLSVGYVFITLVLYISVRISISFDRIFLQL